MPPTESKEPRDDDSAETMKDEQDKDDQGTEDLLKHPRTVNNYDTMTDLKFGLRFGNALDEHKGKSCVRGKDLVGLSSEVQRFDSHGELRPFDSDDEEDDDDDDDVMDDFDAIEAELDPTFDWVVQNLDQDSSIEQTLDDELRRLRILRSYLILDSAPEINFDRLTTMGARVLKAPVCVVSLVDVGRIWFMSSKGTGETRQIPRNMAFCAHAIMSTQDILAVPDALKDLRFKDNCLVSQPPYVRFYAGAPLISPEGVKLGTFCILDVEPRPDGLTIDDRQNMREFAEMAVELMVERRKEKRNTGEDKSKLIACTAHDLLTPLSGVQMSINLLKEDETLVLDDDQKEVLETADNCTDMLAQICHDTIDSFRNDVAEHRKALDARKVIDHGVNERTILEKTQQHKVKRGHKTIRVKTLVNNISMVMDPYPKRVPLYVTVDPALPAVFVSNDLKVFRSVINYLTNACKHTERGCVHLKITTTTDDREKPRLLFEVEDTGNGVTPDKYASLFRPFRGAEGMGNDDVQNEPPVEQKDQSCVDVAGIRVNQGSLALGATAAAGDTPGLGLYSVATNIGSLGGTYGFRPRQVEDGVINVAGGSIFWFSIPYIAGASDPAAEGEEPSKQDRVAAPASAPAAASPSASTPPLAQQSALERRSSKVIVCNELPASARQDQEHPSNKTKPKREDSATTSSTTSCSVISSKSPRKPRSGRRASVVRRIVGGTWTKKKREVRLDESDREDNDNDVDDQEEEDNTTLDSSSSLGRSAMRPDRNVSPCEAAAGALTPLKRVGKKLKVLSLQANKQSRESRAVTSMMSAFSTAQETDEAASAPEAVRTRRVLIIDDSLVIRKSVSRAFEVLKFEVVQACNGQEGLQKLKLTLFDVVLCDFLMPIMDGLDCVQQYRAWEETNRPWFRQYVIGISAHAGQSDIDRAFSVGMDSFRSKPLPLGLIKDIVASDKLKRIGQDLDRIVTTVQKEMNKAGVVASPPAPHSNPISSDDDEDDGDERYQEHGDGPAALAHQPICLIAEDSPTVSKVLVKALERIGWRAVLAENGQEALEQLKARTFDAVLMDDSMPVMTGTKAVEQFRKWEQGNRIAKQRNIVYMSGHYVPPPPGAMTVADSHPPGFDAAIPKPVMLQDLYCILKIAQRDGTNALSSSDIIY